MPRYDWTCSVCGAANRSGLEDCASCGAPASISAWEIEARREGVSSSREYSEGRLKQIAQDPFNRDFAKTIFLFAMLFAGVWFSALHDLQFMLWLIFPLAVYAAVFFIRVWWRIMRFIFTGKAYERV